MFDNKSNFVTWEINGKVASYNILTEIVDIFENTYGKKLVLISAFSCSLDWTIILKWILWLLVNV